MKQRLNTNIVSQGFRECTIDHLKLTHPRDCVIFHLYSRAPLETAKEQKTSFCVWEEACGGSAAPLMQLWSAKAGVWAHME